MRAASILVALLGVAATGRAQPCGAVQLQLDGCETWFEAARLEEALLTEGVCEARLRCDADAVVIGDGPGATSHPLAAMPDGVRARIVALLVAEHARVHAWPDRQTQDPTTQDPTTQDPTTQDPTTQDPTTQDPTTQDPTTQGRDSPPSSPPLAPPTLDARGELGAPREAPEAAPPPLRRATPRGLLTLDDAAIATPDVLIGVGAHARVFLEPATPLGGPSASLSYDAARLELAYGFGVAQDATLGSVTLSLGSASVGARIACGRWADAALCAGAYATIGYARADPDAANAAIGAAGDGVYAGGSAELEAWVSTEHVGLSLALQGGWGYGLIVEAGGREVGALGGGWLGGRLSVDLGAP